MRISDWSSDVCSSDRANALSMGGSTLGGAINAVTPTGRTAPRFEFRLDGGSFSTIRGKAAAGFATARGDAYVALTTDNSAGDRDHSKRSAIRFNGNVGKIGSASCRERVRQYV